MGGNGKISGSGFGRKGTVVGIFAAVAIAACCVVFEVLCLKYFKTGFIARNVGWLVAVACAVTAAGCTVEIVFAARGKGTAYKLFFSGFVLVLFLLVILYVLQKTGFLEIFRDPELYAEYLERAGIWMPLLYIVLQYLQVVILPIPGFVSTAAGVALFGPTKAMLCSLVGVILGSLTAFVIGRKVGYKAVAWIVGKEELDKWLKKVKGKDNFILTAMFVLPLFPDDILCFIAGLSSMSWQYFVAVTMIARSLGIAGTCYSLNFIPFNTWWGILIWVILIALVVASFVILCKKMDAINAWFRKTFRKKSKAHPGKGSGGKNAAGSSADTCREEKEREGENAGGK